MKDANLRRQRGNSTIACQNRACSNGRFLVNQAQWLARRSFSFGLLVFTLTFVGPRLEAQQFNSDNYLTMPHGVGTFVVTGGQNYSSVYGTGSLFRNWEFTIGATLYSEDLQEQSPDHFSTSIYVKHMFHENEAKTGGWAIMGGTGITPGYLKSGAVTQNFRSYWVAAPITMPFLDNALSWDILPGATLNLEEGADKKPALGFTYSTRLAVYKIIPKSAIVGEVFGTLGEAYSKPQYKAGIRWEPSQYAAFAFTYGSALDGTQGPGFEVGMMLFTPPFLCFGGCK